MLFSATILGLILSSPVKSQPLMHDQNLESAVMLFLGLSLIGIARIFQTKKTEILKEFFL